MKALRSVRFLTLSVPNWGLGTVMTEVSRHVRTLSPRN